jgi:hypothetical protein
MRTGDFTVLILGQFFFYTSLWLIDVSVSSMNTGGLMYNIFFREINPIITYHIGLILNAVSTVVMISYFYLSKNFSKSPNQRDK